MKKQILKIFLVMLIFLMGIGAVNAIDNNFTEDLMSFEQSEIGYNNETIEVLSVENNDNEIIAINDNDGEVISGENNVNELIAATGNISECISGENNQDMLLAKSNTSEILNVKNNGNETNASNVNGSQVLSSSRNSPPSDVPIGITTITHSSKIKLYYEEEVFAKVKMTKKDFKRFILKTPSKKNKKLWKKYKKFIKTIRKKMKKSRKIRVKAIKKKYDEIDWYYGIRPIFVLKGKYCTMYWVCMGYNYPKD